MIRIKDILKLKTLSQAKFLTNQEKKNNIVRSVNIMDAPDIINWVKKNELLLTTGFSMYKKINNLDKFIKNLSESGCSGLAIKSNRYFNNIPPQIIKSGNKYGLPIIEIPNDVVLGEVLNEILNEILLKDKLKQNKIIPLLNNSLNFENIENIISTLGQELNYDIAFESPFINKNINYKTENNQDKSEELDTKIFTINKQNNFLGKLIIYFNKNDIYKTEKMPTIHFSLNILEFLLNKKRLELNDNHKLRDEIIDNLINYDKNNYETLLEKLNLLNMNFFKNDCFFQIITISFKDNKKDKISSKDKFRNIINDFENEFKKNTDIQLLGGLYNKNIVFIIAAKQNKKNNEFIDRYTNYLNYLSTLYFPNHDIAIGISDLENKLMQIRNLYFHSIKANNIAYESINNIFQYNKNLGILEDVYDPNNGMTLKKIVDKNLGAIINHNSKKEYIKTLKVYFENNENINKASENLYIHRNSLKYRLDKIEKITNKNIDDLEDKLKLYLGIKAYEIINDSTKKI